MGAPTTLSSFKKKSYKASKIVKFGIQ
jgi:hypothetical protein